MCFVLLCLPGFSVNVSALWLSLTRTGTSNCHNNSLHSLRSQITSRTPSFMARYSASIVLCAFCSCLREPLRHQAAIHGRCITAYTLSILLVCVIGICHHFHTAGSRVAISITRPL
ncbi:TPA: hypothetical protein N0F65_002332 [Lagenidium giganteum]|uniref:Secreted peptide n=1 Tax=Lagenidium giganteum TaxID=4803 RepID=A0AAV2Z6Y3_9STRA|nr:TPA: hypothetical protein N0F65_002332 [Lagenidium giganteum]